MADDEKRRESDEQLDESAPQKDRFLDAIKDLPRLQSAEKMDPDKKIYEPPSPMLAKMGGFAQGCGAILVTLFTVPMVLVAVWFGFYTWGPALLLFAGLAMILSTMGVWRGRRLALIVGITAVIIAGVVGVTWEQFLPAVAALSPIPSMGPIFLPLTRILAMILIATLILDATALLYWARLKPPTRRGMILWGVFAVLALVITVLFQISQNAQRKSWMEERIDEWQGEAKADQVALGSNINVTLGFSFATQDEDEDTRYDVSEAQLQAMLDTGAPLVRVQANGDMIFEAQNPRIFAQDDDDDKSEEELAEKRTEDEERIARQLTLENQFMDKLTASDADLLIADLQYSTYLLVQSDDEDELPWDTFTAMHEERIRHYTELYKPAMYEIVTEPSSYKQYSGVDEIEDRNEELDLWVAHTEQLIDAVKEISPDTRVGVSIAINKDFDLDYYERVLQIEDLDFIGVAIYQPAAWDELNDIMEEHGRPQDFGKELVITETWYGYCLAPQRSMELDSMWLETAVAYAEKEEISTVISNDYGCFLQSGGTLYTNNLDKDGRTEVWETWRDLVQEQAG